METKLFALFIGRSGSGKSAAAASLPKPLEELDFDLRANGIRNCIEQGWLNGADIHFTEFDPFKGYMQIENYLNIKYSLIAVKQFGLKSIDIGSLHSLLRLLDLTSLNAPSSTGDKHLNIAGLAMTGPGDYKFEASALRKIIDYLRIFPCNVVLTTHIVDKYGKAPGADKYASSTVIGEKLVITANLGEEVLGMFNDTYRFSKEIINNEAHYFVEFNTEIAKNSFGIPPGRFDITCIEFWPFFQKLVESIKDGSFKRPTAKQQQQNGGVLAF